MALSEKIRLMEALWDELCVREEEVPVPDWQTMLLGEREREITEGNAKFVDWETAKARVRKRIA